VVRGAIVMRRRNRRPVRRPDSVRHILAGIEAFVSIARS
jgi:hypothetical protein